MRAGAHGLSLLSVPLNVHVLTALEGEPRSLIDLRRAVGLPPQTTMRKHLRALTQMGILERRRQGEFPGAVDYSLGGPGRDLLQVARVLDAWLAHAPGGPVASGTAGAKSVIRALTDGWSSTVMRALAARPLSLTELNRLIPTLNYPSLERRLLAMRLAGQITACPGSGRHHPYGVTPWLRRATGPLIASVSWERRQGHVGTAPIGRIDIEAVFLLAVPVLRFPQHLSGTVRMAVEARRPEGETEFSGALAEVENGKVVSCSSRLDGAVDSWVLGPPSAWLEAVLADGAESLELGGDTELASSLVDRLHVPLIGPTLSVK